MIKQLETMLDGIAATTTSNYVQVGERRNLSIQVSGVSVGGGESSVFTIEVSNDGSVFTPYNRITTNVTNTNAQTDTRVASITLAASGSAMLFFPRDHFNYIRIIGTVTGTAGRYTAVLSAY